LRLEAAGAPEDDGGHDRAAQQAELAATYARYQELMARESAVDFGDQIVLALNLLRARSHVLAAYQRRFRYILVDEFQDTNDAEVSKHLIAARESAGPDPVHLHYETATQEADAVATMIQDRVEAGAWRHEDVAILVRSNRDADAFLRSLNLRTIPWTFSGN